MAYRDVVVWTTRAFMENQLNLMLRNRVVELIFQPPYSSEFNSCEEVDEGINYLRHYPNSFHRTCDNSRFANNHASKQSHQRYIVDLSFKNKFLHSLANPTQCRVIMPLC